MTANGIRQKYLDFFSANGHAVLPSASLLPENDSTLLFTNSGMFPLVSYLAGAPHPAGPRLTNSQKCFRSEDINEVGDHRHNTFFEMLGNWSLGDYFKKEQLNWWFDFLITELHLDPKRLYQTVYVGSADGQIPRDQESVTILQEVFARFNVEAELGPDTLGCGEDGPGVELDFSKQRIFAYRDKNFWRRGDAVGELGGPDSETFYDTGRPHDSAFGPFCHPNCDCGRFLEIGNSVFMQYRQTKTGWEELAHKNVDFGGGLERLAMVVSGHDSVFETDLFASIIAKISTLSGLDYQAGDNAKAFEIIADHVKAATFIVGDDRGLVPANTDQGYIVRRLLRRAIRYGRQLNITEDDWLALLAAEVISYYGDVYPELRRNQDFIKETLNQEEAKFKRTLEKGLVEFNKIKTKEISGETAFNLYQSYGFPLEITEELAAEKGLKVDQAGFAAEFAKHQELSRTASAGKFKGGLADSSEATTRLHTAAHLLLESLRRVLGPEVFQKGSNITAERLRFDFSHSVKMTPEEIAKVEELVNQAIVQELPVTYSEMTLEEAREQGAMGVFDSKYNEKVRVYQVTDFSKEICGGPHVENTKELGHFRIIKEESSSAGVRRIKAILE